MHSEEDCLETGPLADQDQLLSRGQIDRFAASRAAVIKAVGVDQEAALPMAEPGALFAPLARLQRALNESQRVTAAHPARTVEMHIQVLLVAELLQPGSERILGPALEGDEDPVPLAAGGHRPV